MATLKQNSEALRAITDKLKSLPKKNELVELEVTENGEYTPPEGADGFSKVDVAVEDRLGQYFNKTLVSISEEDVPSCKVTTFPEFKGFPNLKKVVVPEGITVCTGETFRNCPMLEEVQLPNSLTSYSSSMFRECASLKKVTFSNNSKASYFPNYMFLNSGIESVWIPDVVTGLGTGVFEECKSLKSARIPSSISGYGDYVFEDCIALSNVVLEPGLKKIGSAMFCRCFALTSIQIPDTVTNIGFQAFRDTSLTEVTLPSALTTIGSDIFRGTKLRTIRFPDSVAGDIGGMAFHGCTELETVYLGNGIRYMSGGGPTGGPFQGCVKLHYIQLSTSCNTIPAHAFSGCVSLKEITIPDNVTTISYRAFNSSGISTLTMLPLNPPSLGSEVFLNCSSLEKILVPSGCGNAYKAATNWSAYADIIVEEGGGDAEGNWLFQNEQITSSGRFDLPTPVDGVSYTAFVDGEEIATVTCEGGVLNFNTEDYRIYLICDTSTGLGWHFHPVDSQVTSGSVSIRINTMHSGGTLE